MSLVIGRFEVVREIGKSELGTVYKAYDPKKKRTVALRVLRADTPQAAERSHQYLLRAKAISVLDSPNIASIYAGAEEQGLAYVVMEYVEGVPLDAALATQQGFSSSELLDITRQVCRGLDHAHSKGIFHRRLTPPGILTEWDGTVKIMDFAADPGPLEGQAGDELRYMSPEQVQGREPDARSNVFNWGAILYEMVTGRKAFGNGDGPGVQREILEVTPRAPEEVIPRMPAGISRVIMKALAKNPEYRFQRAGELVSELEAEVEAAGRPSIPGVPHVNTPAPAPAPQPRSRLTLARTEPVPSAAPELIPFLDSPAPSPPASKPVALSSPPAPAPTRSEPLLGYAVPAPAEPSWTNTPAPPAPVVAAPAEAPQEVAPPPQPRLAPVSPPASLSPKQIKILVAVIGAALLVMVSVMAIDAMHARRLREEAEAAAAAPLVSATSDPIAAAQQSPLPEPEPPQVEMVAPSRTAKSRRKATVAPVALASGQLVITSVPDGAQVQLDGSVAGQTPLALSNVGTGPHLVVVAKAGYAAESRSVVVQPAARSAVTVSLSQLPSVAAVSSEPPGAAIIIDGRDTGKVTPAKLVVGQGSHSLMLRKPGYLETSANMTLNPGETFQFQPTLKPLGNADDIRQVGRFKKLISHGGQENMGRVQVHTFPKGAQIMFNSRMMDHASPAEFLVGAGTYEVTITLTGYKTIRKTITVESNGRMEVNETLER